MYKLQGHPGCRARGHAVVLNRYRMASPDQQQPSPTPGGEEETRTAHGGTLPGGQTLAGRFRIVRFLGQGGMGEVYEAEDLELNEQLALKTIRPEIAGDEDALARFKREIHLARRVTHGNVCRIFDLFRHQPPEPAQPINFLTMELLRGETLSARLRRTGAMPVADAIPIVRQMAAALDAAHQANVIHRDFKSANVMLAAAREGSGSPLRAVVTDFGLARQQPSVGDDSTTSVSRMPGMRGTPAYMAPEQVRGENITTVADIYALGVVMFEMVTGRRPFGGDTPLATALKRLEEPPPSPRTLVPDLAPRWEAAILRCLERDPARRFARASEVVEALEEAAPAPAPSLGRRRWAMAALVLFGIAAGVFFARLPREEVKSEPAGVRARRAVAVLGFKDLSGRPASAWLSTALSEMLTTELAAGETLRTVPGETVARARIELALAAADSYGTDTLARIRRNLGADLVVLGSYVALGEPSGGQIRLDLRLQDAARGETIASVAETGTEGQLFDLVSRTGSRLREKMGVAALNAAQAVQVRAALPSTPEAARLYTEGLARLRAFDGKGAREALEKAVAADPGNALAYSALSGAWHYLGYDVRAREEAQRAFDRSAQLSREDRLAIQARYHEARKEWSQAVESYRTLHGFFPDNLEYGLRLASAQTSDAQGKAALGTIETLRKLPAPARDDPRIDLGEASAAITLSDWKRQQAAASSAARKAFAGGAKLLAAEARLLEGLAMARIGQPGPAMAAHQESRRLHAEAGDEHGVARADVNIANFILGQGDLAASKKTAEQALSSFRRMGTMRGAATALSIIGRALDAQGDHEGARHVYGQSLATYRETGDRLGEATTLNNIAVVYKGQGDLEGAKKIYEQILPIHREAGNRSGEAVVLQNLAITLHDKGELARSRKTFEQVLSIHRQLGGKGGIASVRFPMGRLLTAQGDLAEARKSFEESLAIRKEAGETRGAQFVRANLAALMVEERRLVEAEAMGREVAEFFRKEKSPDSEAFALSFVAQSLLAQGKTAEARKTIEQALPLASKSPHIRLPVNIIAARIRALAGEGTEAASSLRTLLEEARRGGYAGYQLEIRLELGAIERRSGNVAPARALLETVEKEARSLGFGLIARKAAAALR